MPSEVPDFSDLSKITTYQTGVIQSAAFRSLRKHTDACLKNHGITTMQWFVIGTILDAEPDGMRITDLSRVVDTTLYLNQREYSYASNMPVIAGHVWLT
jgi:hypothetical protein